MPMVAGAWPLHEGKVCLPLTMQTTLFELAAAIDAVCEAEDEHTPTVVLQHILNSRWVTFTNSSDRWRVICDDAERTCSSLAWGGMGRTEQSASRHAVLTLRQSVPL